MAPKKVADKTIAAELTSVVDQIYNGPDRDKLSVNYARELVEEKLGLDEGFLKEGQWKARSKEVIRAALEALENAESEPEPSPQPPKRKAKQQPKKGAPAKRAKKSPSPAPEADVPSESGDVDDASEASEQPAKKRKLAKPSKKRRVVSDDDDEASDASAKEPEPAKKKAQKDREEMPARGDATVTAKDDSSELSDINSVPESADKIPDSDDELSDVIDEPPKRKQKAQAKPKAAEKPKPVVVAKEDGNESSSSLSSVIDDGPPIKRKGKGSAAPKAPAARKTKAAATEASPDEATIKQLQGQLLKCGVRKVWAFEFKKGGQTTPKAKINRLKEMLAEIGMTGRFSEARAKEIKMQRELMADLDAVKQWDQTFGVADGGRRSRRGAPVKSFREPSISGDDEAEKDDREDEDGEESDEEVSDAAESSESSDDNGSSEDSEEEEKPKKGKGKGATKRRAVSDEESDSD
ncbi:Putative protein of unknown function [Podospora comata]|uniref:Transcriptional regulator n=1 Tax=Podospora comata TaxID=48703 RepID=A0ABY6SCP6_PODCO|nr:Putative protein of unknown function [Podospora comata]